MFIYSLQSSLKCVSKATLTRPEFCTCFWGCSILILCTTPIIIRLTLVRFSSFFNQFVIFCYVIYEVFNPKIQLHFLFDRSVWLRLLWFLHKVFRDAKCLRHICVYTCSLIDRDEIPEAARKLLYGTGVIIFPDLLPEISHLRSKLFFLNYAY